MTDFTIRANPILPHAVIVEDNYDLAHMYKYALKEAGYFVEIISNGSKALKHLKSVSPRLLLLDLHLPEVDGGTILSSLKDSPAYEDTKIFMVSTSSSLQRLFGDQVDMVLEKPISVKMLTELASRYHPERMKRNENEMYLTKEPAQQATSDGTKGLLERFWGHLR